MNVFGIANAQISSTIAPFRRLLRPSRLAHANQRYVASASYPTPFIQQDFSSPWARLNLQRSKKITFERSHKETVVKLEGGAFVA